MWSFINCHPTKSFASSTSLRSGQCLPISKRSQSVELLKAISMAFLHQGLWIQMEGPGLSQQRFRDRPAKQAEIQRMKLYQIEVWKVLISDVFLLFFRTYLRFKKQNDRRSKSSTTALEMPKRTNSPKGIPNKHTGMRQIMTNLMQVHAIPVL